MPSRAQEACSPEKHFLSCVCVCVPLAEAQAQSLSLGLALIISSRYILKYIVLSFFSDNLVSSSPYLVRQGLGSDGTHCSGS